MVAKSNHLQSFCIGRKTILAGTKSGDVYELALPTDKTNSSKLFTIRWHYLACVSENQCLGWGNPQSGLFQPHQRQTVHYQQERVILCVGPTVLIKNIHAQSRKKHQIHDCVQVLPKDHHRPRKRSHPPKKQGQLPSRFQVQSTVPHQHPLSEVKWEREGPRSGYQPSDWPA